MRKHRLIAAFLCAFPFILHAQITTTSSLVLVPTRVHSTTSNPTPTLAAEDFLLTDNSVPQKISLEDTDHQPLSIVLLLQIGGAAERELPSYAKLGTMLSYITASHPHSVAMVTFDSQPEDQWDFTSNIDDLADGFKDPGHGDRGAAILDAVNHAIDLLHDQPANDRRVIIVVSQEHDEGSTAHDEDIVRRLGENNITIECLNFSPEEAWLKDEFTKPRHENPPYQLSPDLPLIMHTFNLDRPIREALKAMRENTASTIADMSGGEAFSFDNRAALEHQFGTLANDFAATYTLSFQPTGKQPGYHALNVQTPFHPGLQINARTSYWSAPPTAQ
jgi:VWFA-related protein